jgi:protein-tyrosine-phosphatase
LSQESVDLADLIVVMDYQNEALLLTEFPAARPRLAMLGSFGTHARRDGEIADPYNQSIETVQECFASVARCVDGLAEAYELIQPPSQPIARSNDA